MQVYRGDTGRSTRSEVAYYPDQWLNYMKSKERAGHRHKPEQKLRVREGERKLVSSQAVLQDPDKQCYVE